MDKDKVQFLIQNIEVLLEALKDELLHNVPKPKPEYNQIATYLDEYEPDYFEEEE